MARGKLDPRKRVEQWLAEVRRREQSAAEARRVYRSYVLRWHEAGATPSEIAEVTGQTRQNSYQLIQQAIRERAQDLEGTQ